MRAALFGGGLALLMVLQAGAISKEHSGIGVNLIPHEPGDAVSQAPFWCVRHVT